MPNEGSTTEGVKTRWCSIFFSILIDTIFLVITTSFPRVHTWKFVSPLDSNAAFISIASFSLIAYESKNKVSDKVSASVDMINLPKKVKTEHKMCYLQCFKHHLLIALESKP
jgi:hypothetical protein